MGLFIKFDMSLGRKSRAYAFIFMLITKTALTKFYPQIVKKHLVWKCFRHSSKHESNSLQQLCLLLAINENKKNLASK